MFVSIGELLFDRKWFKNGFVVSKYTQNFILTDRDLCKMWIWDRDQSDAAGLETRHRGARREK